MESNVFTSGRWIVLQGAEGETEWEGQAEWRSVDVTSVAATPLGAWEHGNRQQLQWLQQSSHIVQFIYQFKR